MKWKAAAGLILVIASIVCMLLWENIWRDKLTLVEVLVPSRDIEKGELICPEDLTVLKINPQSGIDNSLIPADLQSVAGKTSIVPLKAKQQLVPSFFMDEDDIIPDNFRRFVVPSEWIYSRSAFLEKDKKVRIYTIPETHYLGTYMVADIGDYGFEFFASLEDYYAIYETTSQLGFSLLIVED